MPDVILNCRNQKIVETAPVLTEPRRGCQWPCQNQKIVETAACTWRVQKPRGIQETSKSKDSWNTRSFGGIALKSMRGKSKSKDSWNYCVFAHPPWHCYGHGQNQKIVETILVKNGEQPSSECLSKSKDSWNEISTTSDGLMYLPKSSKSKDSWNDYAPLFQILCHLFLCVKIKR